LFNRRGGRNIWCSYVPQSEGKIEQWAWNADREEYSSAGLCAAQDRSELRSVGGAFVGEAVELGERSVWPTDAARQRWDEARNRGPWVAIKNPQIDRLRCAAGRAAHPQEPMQCLERALVASVADPKSIRALLLGLDRARPQAELERKQKQARQYQ